MQRILVAFASRDGQTEHIAHHIARALEDKRFVIRLIDLTRDASELGADDCDASIVAGSLHMSKLPAQLASFAMRHGPALNRHRSALVCVSLTAASRDQRERAALDEIVQHFLHEVGWRPDHIEHVAGAVDDSKLNMLERVALHAIVEQHGVPLDPSGFTELTDWGALDRFIAKFAAEVKAHP